MAFVSLNAYDADLRIPEFKGLMQYGDGINADPRTASAAENMDTIGGVIKPMAAASVLTSDPLGWAKYRTFPVLSVTEANDRDGDKPVVYVDMTEQTGQRMIYYRSTSVAITADHTYAMSVWATKEPYSIHLENIGGDVILSFSEFVVEETDGDWNMYSSSGVALVTDTGNNVVISAIAPNSYYLSEMVIDSVTISAIIYGTILDVPALASKIDTIAVLYRRWYSGADDKTILVAASGGQLYYMLKGGSAWSLLALPEEWGETGYASDVWSWVTYEINPEGSESPVDVLILSNPEDGMIYVRGDTLTVYEVSTPKKFGVIARYAERIWGGAIPDDPDMLVYSAPFDPTNWEANFDIPEDGAGDIMQPSWDGDSFQALTPLGSQLIAFKKNRIWRIFNTDPSVYIFKEQYGGGTAYARTVAVDGEYIFMLSKFGLMIYDGANAQPFNQEYCKDIWDSLNISALDQACACMYNGVYYCAVPTGTSLTNNAVVIYNTKDRTWLYRTDIAVESFLPTDEALYFTSSASPSNVFVWNENSWESESAATPTKWVGQWQDFGYKNMRKGGFLVYVTVEAKAAGILTIRVETEKKIKTKTYSYPATTSVKAKQKAIRFSGNGRRFRFIIESSDAVAWRLVGGLQINAEIDVD